MRLTPVEVRVLGCLVEKERTTPDVYPLSVNALALACNQRTNREPVMTLAEGAIGVALIGLADGGLAHRSADGGRTIRWAHNLQGKLGLDGEEVAVLCVLLLRGPQTAGELRSRAERLHAFADVGGVEAVLDRLMEGDAPLVTRLERLPGRKEHRYAHLLSGLAAQAAAGDPDDAAATGGSTTEAARGESDASRDAAVTSLQSEVGQLRQEVAELREQVRELKALIE